MKVLFVSSGNSKSGINPIILKQGESLPAAKVTLSFFTVKGKGLKAYWQAIFQLRKELKKERYDIIHAHYALCGWVSLLAHGKEKLVLSFMGDDLLGSNKPGGAISKSSLVMAWLNKVMAKLFFQAAIVKSPQMLDKYGKNDKVHLVANGVDTGLFKPMEKDEAMEKAGLNKGPTHVIFVSDPGRVEKNYELARQACELISEEPVALHPIYGKAIGDMSAYYNAADVLVMTSFHEGSPNVIKEAMACNCPVVCTDIGDVKLLFGTESGHFLCGFDAPEIKRAILAAVAFRKEHTYTTGRKRLQDLKLDAGSVAEKITGIYSDICS